MPKFSILTPAYNRGTLLPYVWLSLVTQSTQDFEWLVGIDGTTDDSLEVVSLLAERCDFPIRVICADLHVGKSVIDNRLISESRGEWILWCDSDDYLSPFCLAALSKAIDTQASEQVYCLLAQISHDLAGLTKSLPDGISFRTGKLSQLTDYYLGSDGLMCVDANILRSERFPEVDFYCPEGILWKKHGTDNAVLIEMNLMVRKFLPDGISRTRKILYPRAKLLVWSSALEQAILGGKSEVFSFVFCCGQAVRFGLHTGRCSKLFTLFRSRRMSLLHLLGFFGLTVGTCAYLLDKVARRVIRTDIEFEKNIKNYSFTSKVFNQD